MRSGIEIDTYGAAVAYHLRKNHPGDVYMRFGLDAQDWERIPARTAFGRQRVLHIHDKERTGQHRGKPLLTSIMPMFKMLDHYERSELQAAVVLPTLFNVQSRLTSSTGHLRSEGRDVGSPGHGYSYFNAGIEGQLDRLVFDVRYWTTDVSNIDEFDRRLVVSLGIKLP